MHDALSGPNPVPPDRMSADERLNELASILAGGLRRIQPQQSSALSAAGGSAEYICFERQIHGFITMGRVMREAHTGVAVCADALKRYLF